MEDRTGQDRVRLLQNVVERGRDPHEDGAGDHPHGLRVLVGQQSQQGSEAAEPGCEENKKWQLLLRIDRHLVEGWQQLSVSAF